MTVSLFCDMCGAALSADTVFCPVCGASLSSSPPPTVRPVANAFVPLALAPSVPAGPLRPDFLLNGRYRTISQIGQGGFATVYKASDRLQRNKTVAIKQIHLSALSSQEKIEATDSYNREIMLLSRMKHRSLPRIYDQFTDPENWYVVMDYIEGRTLEETLNKARGGYLSLNKVLDIGSALCDVLGYLHEQHPSIIFRDVKPANIMITPSNRLYLIDFGIARLHRSGQTKDTGALGSPGYAAPEQYGKQAHTTPCSDIYGLGATLQTLYTGQEPLELLMKGKPRYRKIPRELQTLITRMLERDPGQRPQSMDEVKCTLQQCKEHVTAQKAKYALISVRKVLFGLLALIPLLVISYVLYVFAGGTLPCLVPPCIVCICSAVLIHRDMKEAPIGQKMKELLLFLWKLVRDHLPISIHCTAALIILSYALYVNIPVEVSQVLYPLFPIGTIVCVAIIFGWPYLTNLWSRLQARWRPLQKHTQSAPLQQQQ